MAEPETDHDDEAVVIRVLFERPLDPDAISVVDALPVEAGELFDAWWREPRAIAEFPDVAPFTAPAPCAVDPTNAWLLIGGEDSYFEEEDLRAVREDARVGISEYSWTAAQQTEPGDLLFW